MAKNRKRTISKWLDTTTETIDTLVNFRAYLAAWQQHPELSIHDDLFMSIMDDLAQVGLLDWLDGNPLDSTHGKPRDIDALKAVVSNGVSHVQ